MALTYVCSPLSAPTRAEMLANAAKASTYMMKAEQEFGNRAVAPHAYLPFLLDDTAPEERALALEFGQKLLAMCTRLVVYGDRISSGMSAEIMKAEELGTSVHVNTSTCVRSGVRSRFRPQDNTSSWPPNRLAALDRRRPSEGLAALTRGEGDRTWEDLPIATKWRPLLT